MSYYDWHGQPINQKQWLHSFDGERHVARDRIGEADVSTVHLGLDHNWGDGPPLIFESMIFGGVYNEYCFRYSTVDEARAGHERIVTALREGRSLREGRPPDNAR